MNSATKDRSTGWYGVAIGAFFIALASPGILAAIGGRTPSFVVRHVMLSGTDAMIASAICAVFGLGFIGAGLWCFWGRRHEA
jgi:hypothetical protein